MPAPAPDDDDAPAPWAGSATGPPAAPGKRTTGWREADAGKPGRGPQIAAAAALFLALVGAVVGLLTYIGRGESVAILAVPVSQYKHVTWAANPTADADAARLLRAFGNDRAAVGDQERERFRDRLKALAGHGDGPLVVYVSALAAVRDRKVYLLPAEARPDDAPDQWVSVDEVLAAVAACPANRKALLLDVARPAADPFRGPLLDDVADRLHAALTSSPPPFPVLCSCSPGEVSLTTPERGASAFAVYLEEGLSGAADGFPPGPPDGKVTFAELAEYANRRVARWADKTRATGKTPAVYGPAGADFVLAYRSPPVPPPPPPPVDPAAPPSPPPPAPVYPTDLADGWRRRDEARAGPARWADPTAMADLEAALLRAEIPFWTGTTGRPAGEELLRLESRLTKAGSVPPGPLTGTLFDRTNGRTGLPQAMIDAFDKWRKLRFPPQQPPGAPLAPPKTDEREAAEEELAKLVKGQADDVAELVWSRLIADRELTPERVRVAAEALDAGPFAAEPLARTTEILLVQQLAKSTLPAAAYPDAVGNLFRAEHELARASASQRGGVPGAFDRVRDPLTAADAAKQKAERALFAAKSDAEVRAAADALRTAAGNLRLVGDAVVTIRAAREAWADAADWLRATLPGMVAADVPDAKTWLDVAAAAGPVADWFAGTGPGDIPLLRDRAEALRGRTAKLALPFRPADIKKSTDDAFKRGRPESLVGLSQLVAGGGPTAGDRATVAAAVAKLSADLDRTLRADFDDKEAAGRLVTPKPAARPTSPAATDRAKRRADASVALLRLSGFRDIGRVDQLRAKVNDAPSEPGGWQLLGDELRKAWTVELPKAAATAKWEEADRASRAYPGGLGWADAPARPGGLYREDERARREWLAARYREYGKLRAGFPQAREFFNGLAGEDHSDPAP